MAKKYDWELIKRFYLSGKTAYAIGQMDGMPTKQAVMKHIDSENWKLCPAKVIERLPKGVQGEFAVVLDNIEAGANFKTAAMAAGITDRTLRKWRKDPIVQVEIERVQAKHVVKQIKRIDAAGDRDWKAADRLLQVNPISKSQFNNIDKGSGLTIVLNIKRDEIEIDGVVIDAEAHSDQEPE